jgi:Ca2+-binding EF-hand superfamily protein
MPPAEATPPTEPPAASPEPSQAPPAEARPASPSEVGAMVESEFPTRDSDGDGNLNQAEFTTWLGELVSRSPGEGAPPSAEQIAAAFGQTDTDGSGSVSAAEMTALLARGR